MGKRLLLFTGLGLLVVFGGLYVYRRWIVYPIASSSPAAQPHFPVAATAAPAGPTQSTETKVSTVSTAPAISQPESDDSIDEDAFVAFRHDQTHVLFRVAGAESDFELSEERTKALHSLPQPVAEYGGGPVWEPDAQLVADHRALYDRVPPGEKWQLEITAGQSVPAVVQKPVVVMVGCFAFAGILAEISDPSFVASTKQYFLARKPQSSSSSASLAKPTAVKELLDWQMTSDLRSQIAQLLQSKVKEEATKVHDSLHDEYERMEKGKIGDASQWKQFDERLIRGEGKLDFDARAFQLTPDAVPRVFVRAKWVLDSRTVFLMSAWLRTQPELALESVDSGESGRLRAIEEQGADLNLDALGTIVNVFDLRNNGHGQVLIYNPGYEGWDLHLFRYNVHGLITTGISHGGGC